MTLLCVQRGKDKDEADKKSVTERLNRLAAQLRAAVPGIKEVADVQVTRTRTAETLEQEHRPLAAFVCGCPSDD